MDSANNPTPKSGTPKVLGIIGLVVGILSLVLSFIPCVGALAIYVAPLALIVSVVSLVLGRKQGDAPGLAIAAIVISALATGISIYQYYIISAAAGAAAAAMQEGMKNAH
ncbi:MAG: hypothetical protein JWO06_3728 [Bacteroidota bacterium]|nr:hypothetical protein [Bacteroidota bacterium]